MCDYETENKKNKNKWDFPFLFRWIPLAAVGFLPTENLPSFLPETMPLIFIAQLLTWDGCVCTQKGLEAFLWTDPHLQSAVQDETLTSPASEWEIFIDGRNASSFSTLFRVIVSNIKVLFVKPVLAWFLRSLDAAGLSLLKLNGRCCMTFFGDLTEFSECPPSKRMFLECCVQDRMVLGSPSLSF